MNFLDLKDISERYMRLLNPCSPEKIVTIGQMADLQPGDRVIDFGSGFGEALALWGEYFKIKGVGIDVRPYACERARERLAEKSLGRDIEIVCSDGAEYAFEPGAYDLAACIGASFIWGGFRGAIQAMQQAVKPGSKLVIGEPYWTRAAVPPEFAQEQAGILTEIQLLKIAWEEGYEVLYLVRSSRDEWDRYEADNWYGLLHWLKENPNHPDRKQVQNHLRESQEEYFRYGREYFSWAIFLLTPAEEAR